MLCHIWEDNMLLSKTSRMTKHLSHSSIIINRPNQTRLELIRLAEVLSYLILSGCQIITIHDITKSFIVEKRLIEQFIRRKLERGIQRRQGSLSFGVINEINSSINNATNEQSEIINVKIQKTSDDKIQETKILFISEQENVIDLLKVAKERGKEIKGSEKLIFEGLNKSQKFEKIEGYLHSRLNCYQNIPKDKNVSINPQIILVFNSNRSVLELKGYPMLMKEIAEIFECGNLAEYRLIDFISNIERFSQIEQRWGL